MLIYDHGCVDPVFGACTQRADPARDRFGYYATCVSLNNNTQVHAVGDSAPLIADQTENVFGARSNYLVDFHHLCDCVAVASEDWSTESPGSIRPKDTTDEKRSQGSAFRAGAQCERLRGEDSNAPIRACQRYLRNRLGRFDYPSAEKERMSIGSGTIDSARRYVVREQIKIPARGGQSIMRRTATDSRTPLANANWEADCNSRRAA